MARAEGPRYGAAAARRAALAALLCSGALLAHGARAGEAAPASDDPVLEARVMRVAAELRCLVCQNQTIAESHADLAVDLRNQVRTMLRKGQSEAEVYDYMTARYGDFVLYRPPLKASTALLWFGPAALLLLGAAVLWVTLHRRSRLGAERFEPDLDDDAPPPDVSAPPRPSPQPPPASGRGGNGSLAPVPGGEGGGEGVTRGKARDE